MAHRAMRGGLSALTGVLCALALLGVVAATSCRNQLDPEDYYVLDDTNDPNTCQGDVVIIRESGCDPIQESGSAFGRLVRACSEAYLEGFDRSRNNREQITVVLFGRRECLQGANDTAVALLEARLNDISASNAGTAASRYTLYRTVTKNACDLLVRASANFEGERATLQRLDCTALVELSIANLIITAVPFSGDDSVPVLELGDEAQRQRHATCFSAFDAAESAAPGDIERHTDLFVCLTEWLVAQDNRILSAYLSHFPATDSMELADDIERLVDDMAENQREMCGLYAAASEAQGTVGEERVLLRCQIQALLDFNDWVDDFVLPFEG